MNIWTLVGYFIFWPIFLHPITWIILLINRYWKPLE